MTNNRWTNLVRLNAHTVTRRKLLAGSAAAGTAAALSTFAVPAIRVSAQDTVEIQFMSWPNPEDQKANEALVAEFEELNPNIKVNLLPQLDAYEEKMLAMFAANTPPHTFQLSSSLYRAYQEQELLEDLGSLVERDSAEIFWDDIFENLRSAYEINGTWYGYPFGGDTEVIYYNKDMFAAKGLQDPNELAARGEWTWEALLNAAQTLHEADGDRVNVWGLATIGYWQVYPIAGGGGLFNPEMTECILNTPESLAGVQYLADLVTLHKVLPANTDELGMGSRGYLGAFTGQRAGMYAHGIWEFRDVAAQATDFAWDIAPEAIGPSGNPVAYTPPGSHCISAASRGNDHIEESWAWIKFMNSRDKARQDAITNGSVPSYTSVAQDPAVREAMSLVEIPEHILVNLDQAQYANVRELLPTGAAQFYDIQAAEFDRLYSGDIDATTAVNNIVEQTNPLLQQS